VKVLPNHPGYLPSCRKLSGLPGFILFISGSYISGGKYRNGYKKNNPYSLVMMKRMLPNGSNGLTANRKRHCKQK